MLREHTAPSNGHAVLYMASDSEIIADSARTSLEQAPLRMTPRIQSRPFGELPAGRKVNSWLLTGRGGLTLECLDYGGIVTRLLVPDYDGNLTDVLLGFDELESYLVGSAHFGAIVGRVAGRIPGAKYRLNGTDYSVAGHNSADHLRGSESGFDKRVWSSTIVDRPDGAPSLKLSLTSPHLDQGHPGTVEVSVTYTVTDNNGFMIETEASTDQLTPFSMAHRCYINLAGEASGNINGHELQIHSDECVSADDQMTPLGFVEGLKSPGNDFRRLRSLDENIPHLYRRHGDLYRLRMSLASEQGERVPAARLVHRPSGRVLDVSTSSRCIQLYTGSELDEPNYGKSGTSYGRHSGICLECQGYPGGVSHPELGNIMLRPGQIRRETTAYVFSNIAH